MAYSCKLPHGPELFLDNVGDQTIVRLWLQQHGQQQQSSSSFLTGPWQVLPQVRLQDGGAIVIIHGAIEEIVCLIQGMNAQMTSRRSVNNPAKDSVTLEPSSQAVQGQSVELNLVPVEESSLPEFTMQPMNPMQPMQPMQMGNMQMNPMTMQMGNMQMSMGQPMTFTAASMNGASGKAKFCSQCGTSVQPSDRFCSSCGHSLQG